MPWSKNPTSYAELWYDVLDYARDAREKIELEVPIGEEGKYRGMFYAFKTSWEKQAEREEKKGRLDMAQQARGNAETLMRYGVMVQPGKLVLVNKNVLALESGVKVKASERKANDVIIDQIQIAGRVRVEDGKIVETGFKEPEGMFDGQLKGKLREKFFPARSAESPGLTENNPPASEDEENNSPSST